MKKNIPTYPIWICHPCGMRHGNKKCGVATWHENTCDICGDEASVTEPRDYGHLKDTWIKATESPTNKTMNTDTPRTPVYPTGTTAPLRHQKNRDNYPSS